MGATRAQQDRRRAAGLCPRCGGTRERQDRQLCQSCRAYHRDRVRRQAAASAERSRDVRGLRRAAGLCAACGRSPMPPGKHCDACRAYARRTKQERFRAANPDYYAIKQRATTVRLRDQVLNHYGRACACCGVAYAPVLCIDHVNGGGSEHRRQLRLHGGGSFYGWLKRNGWPTGFQTLCFNCNMARALAGNPALCPMHPTTKERANHGL